MSSIIAVAKAAGALVVWYLSHSAGAIEVDLTAAGAELAVDLFDVTGKSPARSLKLLSMEKRSGDIVWLRYKFVKRR